MLRYASIHETTYKKIIKKHQVPLFVVAEHIGYSYAYTSHLLSGHVKMPIGIFDDRFGVL